MTAAIDGVFARARREAETTKRSRVDRDMDTVRAIALRTFGENLAALLLVGGRDHDEGESIGDGTDAPPFNDYDLVAVLTTANEASRDRAAAVAAEATAQVGREVDVWPMPLDALRAPPPTLFWLDVALGGARVLAGDASVLDGVHRLQPRDVPLEEGGRLLAHRAIGLALSRLDDDVTLAPLRAVKHVFRAILACGDARLLAAGAYAPTLAARALGLEHLADRGLVRAELAGAYRAAALFRARPDRFPIPADMPRWFDEHRRHVAAWHMGFESFRLGLPLTPLSFAWRSAPLYPRRVDGVRVGAPTSVRAFLRGEAALFPYVGHPRERLARAAAALAYLEPRRAHALAARWLELPGSASSASLRAALVALSEVAS